MIPILFNDHHVYSKPDVLKQGRVVAALVKNGTLLVPLRSMFEQMGATVSYDAGSRTVTVSKAGSEVKVTVGKPEVVINGESRPLDVPPVIYQGNVLVPVRVISEGMGAYVQWVPDRHVVVVRYVPPAPPPAPAPTQAPTEAATTPPPSTPTPAPLATPYRDRFVAGDYMISPKIYNEFSPGNAGSRSYHVRGALEFDALNLPWMIEVAAEQYVYPHNCANNGTNDPQCMVRAITGKGSTYVQAFTARDIDWDVRFGLRVLQPKIYVVGSYLNRSTNYGYPVMNGAGFGVEKLPDLNTPLSFYGGFLYYPSVSGNITTGAPPVAYQLSYTAYTYQAGLNYVFGKSPIFLDLGWKGNAFDNRSNAPGNVTANGPYAGLGIKF